MNRKDELEIVLEEILKFRQSVYRLRHDLKMALLKGENHEWVQIAYMDTSRTLDNIAESLKSLREELRNL